MGIYTHNRDNGDSEFVGVMVIFSLCVILFVSCVSCTYQKQAPLNSVPSMNCPKGLEPIAVQYSGTNAIWECQKSRCVGDTEISYKNDGFLLTYDCVEKAYIKEARENKIKEKQRLNQQIEEEETEKELYQQEDRRIKAEVAQRQKNNTEWIRKTSSGLIESSFNLVKLVKLFDKLMAPWDKNAIQQWEEIVGLMKNHRGLFRQLMQVKVGDMPKEYNDNWHYIASKLETIGNKYETSVWFHNERQRKYLEMRSKVIFPQCVTCCLAKDIRATKDHCNSVCTLNGFTHSDNDGNCH